MECDKHPINLKGLSPKEFAKEFGNTNYFYQEACFDELIKVYKKQSKGDKKRKRIKLSRNLKDLSKSFYPVVRHIKKHASLENLSTSFYLVFKSMKKVCEACKNYMKNPYKDYNNS